MRIPSLERISRVLPLSLAGVLLALSAGARAQSYDGVYEGGIRCGLLSGLTRPLQTPFTMTVSGRDVRYAREIVRPGGPTGTTSTGSFERGGGTVAPSGEVALTGAGEGGFSFDAAYRGRIDARPIRLAGTQRWQIRGQTEERSCEIELAPPAPR